MLAIFKQYQLDIFRDRFAVFFLVVFPSVLVFFLGTMLASMDSPDRIIEPFTVEYLAQGDDTTSKTVVEQLVTEFSDVEQMNLVSTDSLAASQQRLLKGEIDAVVVFGQPFSIQIIEGNDAIANRAIHMIFAGVARMTGSYEALAEALAEQQVMPLATEAFASAASTEGLVAEKEFGISRTMMDYYALSMIVMILVMGGLSAGASSFYDARKSGTLRRTLVSPNNRSMIYIQYALSFLPAAALQVLVVMVVSTLFFGAHYAATWQQNLLLFVMLFVAGQAVSTVSNIIGILVRRTNPMLILMPLAWVLLFMSGTFNRGIFIDGFTQYLPPYAIQAAAFDLTLFGRGSGCLQVIVVSLVVIAVALVVGTLLFNRKKVFSNA